MSEETKGGGFFDGNPKTMFLFGFVSGVAVVLILNSLLGGFNVNAAGGNNKNNTGKVVVPTQQVVNTATGQPAGELAAVTDDEHILGDLSKAKVVLVEYSDFECPFCANHHPSMQQAVAEYGDDVAWVYRHFPLSFHPQAQPAAIASECAADQGEFWAYADALIENQASLGPAYYSDLAGELGLNVNTFNNCLEDAEVAQRVTDDMNSGRAAGVSGTPATFVNGTLISGAVPYASLKQVIDAALATAE
ncbi:DsbA family protein [Patescibacteria group bacterium]|nr:DsbA family protein [Patescibacteria group bacterium]